VKPVMREIVEVLNKVDLLEPDVQRALLTQNGTRAQNGNGRNANGRTAQIALSAWTGEGCDALLALLDSLLSRSERHFRLSLSVEDGAGLAWAHAHARILDRRDSDKSVYLVMAAEAETVEKFAIRFPDQIVLIADANHPEK
jgi:GTP-binding protein HflX